MVARNGAVDDQPVEDRVEEIAEDMRVRMGEVAEQARAELAGVQDQMADLRVQVAERAVSAKERLVAEMLNAAVRIRQEAEKAEEEEVQLRAADLAHELERSAAYLETHTFEEIGDDVTEVAQEHVWRALGIAFIIGLVLGLLIGSSRR